MARLIRNVERYNQERGCLDSHPLVIVSRALHPLRPLCALTFYLLRDRHETRGSVSFTGHQNDEGSKKASAGFSFEKRLSR